MGSVGIYSALYGGYDTIKPCRLVRGTPKLDVMYHDQPEYAQLGFLDGWEPRYVPHNVVSRHGDPALVAPMLAHKFWKTHPARALPGVDVSIWIDASITLHEDFVDYALDALGEDDWALIRHPWRSCIYDEAFYSATLPRYASLADDLHTQAAWYRELGHPARWGLAATGVLVRRHTPEVIELCEHWWQECLNWSHQDQVSLPVLLRMYEDRIKFNWNLGWWEKWELWPHLK